MDYQDRKCQHDKKTIHSQKFGNKFITAKIYAKQKIISINLGSKFVHIFEIVFAKLQWRLSELATLEVLQKIAKKMTKVRNKKADSKESEFIGRLANAKVFDRWPYLIFHYYHFLGKN